MYARSAPTAIEYSGFIMNGGSIAGNTGSYSGGVYVDECATFTMNNGSITDNVGNDYGGVAFGSCTFTMTGGTITGNTGTYGGVCVEGVMNISGKVTITGNTGGNVVMNGGTLMISDYLVSTSSIGISCISATPTSDTPVKVVDGFTGSNASLKSFFSDNNAYVVRKNGTENYLELRVTYTVTLTGSLPFYRAEDSAGGYHTSSFSAAEGDTIILKSSVLDKR